MTSFLLVLLFAAQTVFVPSAPGVGALQHATPERGELRAARTDAPIQIDGLLDEAAWRDAPPVTGLMQREPDEGLPASQRTVVRVLYDNDALYVGARMDDAAADSIVARLGRRDSQLESDYFAFFIDPYLDRRSGFYFAVTAAGTLLDGVLLNDDWDDDSWDGVWQGRAQIDSTGWTAELRIPYSQLRFHERDEYRWGANVKRFIARRNEHAFLVYAPKGGSGFVSRFPNLVGVKGIAPRRAIEIMPYVTSRAEYTHPDAADPFRDGSRYVPGIGGDLRVGLTSNLTLNATVNPDFGQVEVDPAVVNLSDFETFYDEKRPFFLDGASIFSFGQGGSHSTWGFNWSSPSLFYSRRVGRVPQGSIPEADFEHRPDVTGILGAAKISGRIGSGWSVGTIHALTGQESARYVHDGERHRRIVEAPTYYGVLRTLRELDEGRHAVGLLATSTARAFEDGPLRNELNTHSFVVGADGWSFLDAERVWVINGWTGVSHVRGTADRMTGLQRSALHYFQRPDARHYSVDSTATALSGWAGRVGLNKQKGNVLVNAAIGAISPSFDSNDAGFQSRSDVINGHIGTGYRWTRPGRLIREALLLGAYFRSLNFDGNTTWTGLWSLLEFQLLNYYAFEFSAAYNPETVDPRHTRGGPLTLNPPGVELYGRVESDRRKPWIVELEGSSYRSNGGTATYWNLDLMWKPASNLDISVGPEVEVVDQPAQWVDAFDDPLATSTYGRRYVFAQLDQVTVSANIRVNWTFTPGLSFQLFAQPLISAGDFSEYKELARSRSFAFNVYGQGNSTLDEATLVADPDGSGPAGSITLPNQDFNFRSLRGNAVLRWEYRPGSVLYLVWTQLRSISEEDGAFRFQRSVNRLWSARPDNVFMIKVTYWIG